jgi:hypothetical protein
MVEIDSLSTAIVAAGGLGIAAFGVVEGLKWFDPVGLAGYRHVAKLLEVLGPPVHKAYGSDTEAVLQAQYRDGRNAGELPRTLRQGYRIGISALAPEQVAEICRHIGVADGALVHEAAAALRRGEVLADATREALARFEVAADARIDAAMCLAADNYATQLKVYAGALAIAIALVVGYAVQPGDWLKALVIGFVAVPIAPVAKDLASAVGEAAKAIRGRA